MEHALNVLLKKQIPFFEKLDKLNLEYEVKVTLAISMGLNAAYEKPLKGIANLRNKFAHRPGFKLSKSDTSNMYDTFASEDKEIIQGAFHRTNKNLHNDKKSFKALEPIDQFILLAVTIRQIVILAQAKW